MGKTAFNTHILIKRIICIDMKPPIIFNANERKRLNTIAKTSPYANTQWLIQKIRLMEIVIKKYQNEIEDLEDTLDETNQSTSQLSSQHDRGQKELLSLRYKLQQMNAELTSAKRTNR